MTKRTGPTKETTRKLIVKLEKYGKKNKQNVWLDLSERLGKARRKRAEVDIEKLENLSKKIKGKIFVVPGKVLGRNKVNEKLSVAALGFSSGAKEAIKLANGSSMNFDELMVMKPKASDVVIVE